MSQATSSIPSSLKDNRAQRGTVGQFLESKILPDSVLSFVSAYFTVHAYEALSAKLENAQSLRFLFGEPSFIAGINKGDEKKANFKLTEAGIEIAKTLTQGPAAKACAEWIDRMVEIKSIRNSNFLQARPIISSGAIIHPQFLAVPISRFSDLDLDLDLAPTITSN